ncbi:MAG: hypothetical protein M0023_07940, partial [Desulfobacteraceae bacterium]|nr:hypothetical protein [Desulfobacteraceae bacterium]
MNGIQTWLRLRSANEYFPVGQQCQSVPELPVLSEVEVSRRVLITRLSGHEFSDYFDRMTGFFTYIEKNTL